MKKKRIYTEEQKTKMKISQAAWKKANPEKKKACDVRFYENNPNYIKERNKEWRKANPDGVKEHNHEHDLGFWVVYLIHNFDGLNNIYCGQTQNLYMRMQNHKSKGKLNTETYEVLEKFDTVKEALGFELTLHLDGYHGNIFINN